MSGHYDIVEVEVLWNIRMSGHYDIVEVEVLLNVRP